MKEARGGSGAVQRFPSAVITVWFTPVYTG